MNVWFKDYKIENFRSSINIDKHLEIEFVELGDNYLKAKMPVNEKTRQPLGLLHGGASCVIAESTASCAAYLTVDPSKKTVVGLSLTANHIKSITKGFVYAIASPNHIGKSTSVWNVKIEDEKGNLVSKIVFTAMHKDIKK
jgi:uncharacterized domain 1